MSMLEPKYNTILWTHIMALPRCVTRASSNLQQGVGNDLPMNANAIEEMLEDEIQGTR